MELPVVGYVALSRLVGLAAILLVVVVLVPRLFRREKLGPHLVRAQCGKCGWQGSVSRYKPTCPKCASAITI